VELHSNSQAVAKQLHVELPMSLPTWGHGSMPAQMGRLQNQRFCQVPGGYTAWPKGRLYCGTLQQSLPRV